jgi:hypothetical protein
MLARIADGRGAWWHQAGTNHRTEGEWLVRDEPPVERWFIDIPDLDALIALAARYGRIIVNAPGLESPDGEILIYDDYIE